MKNGRKGGQASSVAKRRKKAMKAAGKLLADMPVTSKELQQKMKLLGVPEGDTTYQMAIMVAMLNQAMKGNVNAACFIRDTIGESPGDNLRRDELKLSKARVELEQARSELEREKFEYEKAGTEREEAFFAEAIQAAYEARMEREGLDPSRDADGGHTEAEGA